MEEMFHAILCCAMGTLAILTLFCLLRCILGPRISDRVMSINMIGTLTIAMVAVMTVMLGEGYLADIGLVYAMISFLSVIVLCKIFTGLYRERKHDEKEAARNGGKEAQD